MSHRRIVLKLNSRCLLLAACALLATLVQAQSPQGTADEEFLSGFVDDLGHRVNHLSLQRPLRLVFFGYTSCPDVCPLTLAAVHQALEALGPQADRIDPVFVTVDPGRDSVARLHSYVSAFDPRIRGYRAEPRQLDRLVRRLQVHYEREEIPGSSDYGVSHTATLFLLDRDGRLLARIYHYTDPSALSDEIQSAVRPVIGGRVPTEHGR